MADRDQGRGPARPGRTGRDLRVVVAADKFKGTLTGAEANAAVERGVRAVLPGATVSTLPVADGGEGTLDALLAVGAQAHEVTVQGPLTGRRTARIATLDGTAFVEAAQACGLQLLDPTPATAVTAHSHGVGEMVRAALDRGCERVVVTLGGVACTDGGAGLATALGAQVLDATGHPVGPGGRALAAARDLDLSDLDPRLAGTAFVAACDVTSPLIGPTGAAHVFAPQKGAGAEQVDELDAALGGWARLLRRRTGRDVDGLPGGGAAGGLAAGMVALLDAEIASGCALVLGLLGFHEALADADLVITGEGRLDDQSLAGKAPVVVARLARQRGVPTVAVAGRVDVRAPDDLRTHFESTWSMVEVAGADRAVREPADVLAEVVAQALRARAAAGPA